MTFGPIEIISFFTILMTGFFSIYGLLHPYKDKDGKLTKHGRIAVYGIVLSLTLSVVGFGIKLKKDSDDKSSKLKQIQQDLARQQLTIDKLDSVITNVDRLNYPLSDLQIISTFIIPDTSKEIESFHSRFKTIINDIKGQRKKYGVALNTPNSVYDIWDGDILRSVFIEKNAPIFPSDINLPTSVICFFDKSKKIDSLDLQKKPNDFDAVFTAPVYGKESSNIIDKRLTYFPETNNYELKVTYTPQGHFATGNVISHKDIQKVRVGISILLNDDIKDWKIGSIIFRNKLGYQTKISSDSLIFTQQSWPKLTYAY